LEVSAPEASPFVSVNVCSFGIEKVLVTGLAGVVDLLDAAAIAALRTTVNGGLIPQAKHGGSAVEALAVAGSKFDGTGLLKEQIGQIQVPLEGLGATRAEGRKGLALLDEGGDRCFGVGGLIVA
jgi:hypothetical protein